MLREFKKVKFWYDMGFDCVYKIEKGKVYQLYEGRWELWNVSDAYFKNLIGMDYGIVPLI